MNILRNQILLILLLIFGNSLVVLSQIKQENRYPKQAYIEDSSKVYWAIYPNPFSPPTINEYTKGLFCGSSSFYCELSDSVLVAIKNEKDSIIYSQFVYTLHFPHFSYCTWVAGSQIDKSELPKSFYHFENKQKIKVALIVEGKEKCYREGTINDKRYYWIQNNKRNISLK
ncbi:MAG: hypothetical protein IPH62_19350 [Ignavibacteriae bacterium]|nr:hypothetical protein [Ignavibacteriota bacterium]